MTTNRSRIPSASRPNDPAEAPDTRVDLVTADEAELNPLDYAVGQVVSGRFRVESVIGIGSMGVVLSATHLELDERVAIKFIRKEMQEVPGVVQRFAREAKATVSLKSEHIARVFDVGTVDGVGPYIVMELLDGQDLGKVLEREGKLPIRRAVHYVLQACEALAAAHSSDITHRDMKPENLLLTQQGELELIKLLDFGISKATLTGRVFGDELSGGDTACLLGTPLYMSPEQIQATDSVDHRTDIWSLGAVLYELVTGESAFVADSVKQVWHRILETEPVPIVQYCPEAPPSLQLVLDRCLAKQPSERFQNVAEFAMALLPFAPSRARTYAQRAASILGIKSESIFPAGLPLSLDPRASLQYAAPPSSLATVTVTQASPVDTPVAPVPKRSSRVGLTAAMVAAAGLVGWGGVWFGSQSPEIVVPALVKQAATTGAQPAIVPPLVPSPQQQTPPEPRALSNSRGVRLESSPPGAVVKVAGQVLGLTPLTVKLPSGLQQVKLSKSGYRERELLLQLEPAPVDADPMVARVDLEAKREVPTPKVVRPKRRPARPVRKALRRPSVKVAATAPASAQPAPKPVDASEKTRRPRTLPAEETRRPKLLLDEEHRAKILE